MLAARDIEWLEAAENYVNLHVRGRVYPLRSTMTAIQEQLDPQRFVRVHRSYIVNPDFLVQIEPVDTGNAHLLLKGWKLGFLAAGVIGKRYAVNARPQHPG